METPFSRAGRWWRGNRDRFILASKVHGPTGPRPWDAGLSRRRIGRWRAQAGIPWAA